MLRPPSTGGEPQQVTTTDADGNTVTSICGGEPDPRSRLACTAEAPDWTGEYLRCELIRDEDGTKVGAVSTERDRGTTYHNVTLVAPDGGSIYFYVADSTGEKPGYRAPTADEPPLTFAEVKALAQDPAWTGDRP